MIKNWVFSDLCFWSQGQLILFVGAHRGIGSWELLRMRNVLRCLRQLRPAFQRRHCVLFSVNVGEESPCHFGKSCHIHSSAYRVIDPGETNFVKNHSFVAITRALSTDVAKLRNTGSHLFFSRCAGFRRVWNLFSSYFFLYLNLFSKLQKQPKLGLLLSMNEELLMVNL